MGVNMNEIIRYAALGFGIAVLIFLGYLSWKLHAFSRLMDEARDKENNDEDDKKGEDK